MSRSLPGGKLRGSSELLVSGRVGRIAFQAAEAAKALL